MGAPVRTKIAEVVPMPRAPFRDLLLTWPLRQVRDGITVPPIEIPDHVLSRSDHAWREHAALEAWNLEQQYGVADLLDRLESAQEAFAALADLGFDIESSADNSIVSTLRRIKADTRREYAATRGRAARRKPDARETKIRARLTKALGELAALRDAQYVSAPGDDPHSPTATKYRALLGDFAPPLTSAKNPAVNPTKRIVAAGRGELTRIGVPADLATDLLIAVGVVVPAV